MTQSPAPGPEVARAVAPGRARAHAEILLRQSRTRIGLAVLVAAVGLALYLTGHLARLPAFAVAALGLYVVTVAALDVLMRRSGQAPSWAPALTVLADILLVCGVTFPAVEPQYYDRALLFSFAVMHLTEFYFGRTLAWCVVGIVAAAYLAAIAHGVAAGAALSWPQELWSLAAFVFAASVFLALYGDFKGRLAAIVALFERAEQGDFTGTYEDARDARPDSITAVGRAYNRVRAQLATMVLTDPLSGCLNRRGLEQELARELGRAARSNGEVALIALDIDYFKTVNDTFGHLAGDAVIREVGTLLREVVRSGDVIARLGGDEFAVLLPGTSAAGAFKLATRIRDAFVKRQFAGVAGRIPITASIGVVADRAVDEGIAHDLQSRADEALYAAKHSGRNRVCIWTPNLRTIAVSAAQQQVLKSGD